MKQTKESSKESLLRLMNALDFCIADIAVINGKEYVGKKHIQTDEIVYWEIEREGSGFTQLFKGEIKKALKEKS